MQRIERNETVARKDVRFELPLCCPLLKYVLNNRKQATIIELSRAEQSTVNN